MIAADDLVALVRNYNPKTNEALIRAAYDYGREMHEGQFRHSGEPYFSHPVSVAAILTEQQLDDATIITALLHDTIEDTKSTYSEVSRRFGSEVAMLVDGVTKLTNLQLSSSETKQAENFRKLFMAMSKDLRVILVKLADRLHNMRTIKAMKPEKQVQKARETMDIYAPLAGRMGMQWMREELEDLAFRVLNPEGRASIIRRFITLQKETGDVIHRITGDMRSELDKAGVEAEVFGRAKKPYSIWRKMQEKEIGFSRLSDIYGFRIITRTKADCYATLGVIHQRWRAIPGRFKDYISEPKSNGYRSIHTTVSGRDGKRVEVQIRTRQMHDVAETGVAAHWSYRDGVRSENPFAVDPAKWVASLTEQFVGEDDHEDFLEAVKLEMYPDKVFCFTPKGDVVKLPAGRHRSTLRMPFTRGSGPAVSVPRLMASAFRSGPVSRTVNRSTSSRQRGKARRPLGWISRQPARQNQPSAGNCARRGGSVLRNWAANWPGRPSKTSAKKPATRCLRWPRGTCVFRMRRNCLHDWAVRKCPPAKPWPQSIPILRPNRWISSNSKAP